MIGCHGTCDKCPRHRAELSRPEFHRSQDKTSEQFFNNPKFNLHATHFKAEKLDMH